MSSDALGAVARAHGARVIVRHTALVRLCHWINALCFFALLMSGLQIFNAHPMLNWGATTDFDKPFLSLAPNGFPSWATLPQAQDLAAGRRWHFFFAWALVLNGAVYVGNLIVRRHIADFLPDGRELRSIPKAVWDHARLKFPKGDEALRYNVLQKLAYLSVIVALPILVLAGLTMSPAMDSAFPWLVSLFGGRQSARSIHFLLASYLVGFVVVHLAMVLVSGLVNNMISMITGRYRIEEESHDG
jgi:thiosulfate reductase cytochrome b subunit